MRPEIQGQLGDLGEIIITLDEMVGIHPRLLNELRDVEGERQPLKRPLAEGHHTFKEEVQPDDLPNYPCDEAQHC